MIVVKCVKHSCQWIKHSGYTRFGKLTGEEKATIACVAADVSRGVRKRALAYNCRCLKLLSFSFFLVPHSFVNDRQTMSARETGSLSTTSAHTYGHTSIVYKSNGRYSNAHTHTSFKRRGASHACFCSEIITGGNDSLVHVYNVNDITAEPTVITEHTEAVITLICNVRMADSPYKDNGYWSMHIERRLCQCWWRWCRDPLSQQYQRLW